MSDYIDFEDVQVDESEQADVSRTIKRISSLNAKAVMPDGSTMSRGQILSALGLNPGTSPTAWLTIVACGSNASALLSRDLQRVAASRLTAVSRVITGASTKPLSGIGGGFSSGGSLRDAPSNADGDEE